MTSHDDGLKPRPQMCDGKSPLDKNVATGLRKGDVRMQFGHPLWDLRRQRLLISEQRSESGVAEDRHLRPREHQINCAIEREDRLFDRRQRIAQASEEAGPPEPPPGVAATQERHSVRGSMVNRERIEHHVRCREGLRIQRWDRLGIAKNLHQRAIQVLAGQDGSRAEIRSVDHEVGLSRKIRVRRPRLCGPIPKVIDRYPDQLTEGGVHLWARLHAAELQLLAGAPRDRERQGPVEIDSTQIHGQIRHS